MDRKENSLTQRNRTESKEWVPYFGLTSVFPYLEKVG